MGQLSHFTQPTNMENLFSVYSGSAYHLFGSHAAASAYADEVNTEFENQNHPFRTIVEEGGHSYWRRPAYMKGGVLIGAEEARPIEAGDDSPQVATAVATWWRRRNAAWAVAR